MDDVEFIVGQVRRLHGEEGDDLVIAYHLILSAYGFWLPNDPRGSWSEYVGSRELFHVGGPATKVSTTASVASQPHDRDLRLRTKQALQRPPVRFTGRQAVAIAGGFARAVAEREYGVRAGAILPDHTHLVILRKGRTIELMSAHLKARATLTLRSAGLWPDPRSPWAHDHWGVFIDSADYLHRAVKYVESNPMKHGLRPQRWRFVTPLR